MKYIFNNIGFETKKEVDHYIRKIKTDFLKKTSNQIITPNHELWGFFNEIVNVHNNRDEKIGDGIKMFYFMEDVYKNNQLRILRMDGTTIDCSCSYSKITSKTNEYNYNLNSALRVSINYQIQEFKENKELKCAKCGDTDKCEVDHIIPFHSLRDNFIKNTNPPAEFDDDMTGKSTVVFKEKDLQFENEWQQYHRQNATYQILCKTCNRIKSGKM